MDSEVEKACLSLVGAIDTIMNPGSSNLSRIQAYKLCEDFKTNSLICLECGFYLSRRDNSPLIRHSGFQLVEYYIKMHWNAIELEKKEFLKNHIMDVIIKELNDNIQEPTYVKEAVARVLVEIIKREWPQKWRNLTQELEQLCQIGFIQQEIVLMIFLRLAEDVVSFQALPQLRRKDISQTLNSCSSQLIALFLNLMMENFTKYKLLKVLPDSQINAEASRLVVITALHTLIGYVEWVNLNTLFSTTHNILLSLIPLLSEADFQILAAECMLLILKRKGKIADRKAMVSIFGSPMESIYSSISDAITHQLDPNTYQFLKFISQVLSAVGSQLFALWVEEPFGIEGFEIYMTACLDMVNHPSLMISGQTHQLWAQIFQNAKFLSDTAIRPFIPIYLERCIKKLLKVGQTSTNPPTITSQFSKMDFESDEDFSSFFIKTRTTILDNVKLLTLHDQELTFSVGRKWMLELLHLLIPNGNGLVKPQTPDSSVFLLEWDAMCGYMDNVASKIFQNEKCPTNINEGKMLMSNLVLIESEDHAIVTATLTGISCLLGLASLDASPEEVMHIVNKLLTLATFTVPGQTRQNRNKAAVNVRRFACSLMIKFAKLNPEVLLQIFDHLKSQIHMIISNEQYHLSLLEVSSLIESLIIISNSVKNYERQCEFIAEVTFPIKTYLTSNSLIEWALENEQAFAHYTGLDADMPNEDNSETVQVQNRYMIGSSLLSLLNIVKRSVIPTSYEECNQGGFVLDTPSREDVIHYRNPVAPLVLDCLNTVLKLLRNFNHLWANPNGVHPCYKDCFSMLESEKTNIIGEHNPIQAEPNTNGINATSKMLDRIRNFLYLNDTCLSLLGAFCSLGVEFYSVPDLSSMILNSALDCFDNNPVYKLKPIIHNFMKPFVTHCPTHLYSTTVMPVLERICVFMYTYLTSKWIAFKNHINKSNPDDQDVNENEELIDDCLLRHLSREYFEMLSSALVGNKKSNNSDMMEVNVSSTEVTLSEEGIGIMRSPILSTIVVKSIMESLQWQDSGVCIKSIALVLPILNQLLKDKIVCSNNDADYFFQAILLGLQEMGQCEALRPLLLATGYQAYILLRPKFPHLRTIFSVLPNYNESVLEQFEKKVFSEINVTEKVKKEFFKTLVSGCIGKSLNKLHPLKLHFSNLGPLVPKGSMGGKEKCFKTSEPSTVLENCNNLL